MATIGVLTYTLPPGLKLKSSLNNISISNLNSGSTEKIVGDKSLVTRIQDISMISGEVLVMRKKQKLVPLLDSNVTNIQQSASVKKIKIEQSSSPTNGDSVKSANQSMGKKSTPLPQAVARRNARERNRVKQVNNGFAALRQRIPEEIAEAFEAAGSGRGTAKKLSKVETLRMAVEYIRSLERLLEIDVKGSNFDDLDNNNGKHSKLMTVIPTSKGEDDINKFEDKSVIKSDSYSATFQLNNNNNNNINNDNNNTHYQETNLDSNENSIYYNNGDILPDITMINGQQYLRIPGTNTYQLILPSEVFENEENVQPISPEYSTGIEISAPQEIEYTFTIQSLPSPLSTSSSSSISPANNIRDSGTIAPASITTSLQTFGQNVQQLSPLSPADNFHRRSQQHQQQQLMQQGQNGHLVQQQNIPIKAEELPAIIYQSQLMGTCSSPLDEDHLQQQQHHHHHHHHHHQNVSDIQIYEEFQSLKREIKEEHQSILDTAALSEESMMEAIDWWDANTPQSDDSSSIVL